MLKIGKYTIRTLETGSFALDGGAMFGIVPKPLWEKTNPADEKNRIDMRLRCLLIQKEADSDGPAENLLIDCGMGTKWADKHYQMYKIDYSKWSLRSELKKLGLIAEDITGVIATHLHFDHVGGLTYRENPTHPNSDLLPTFPNARLYIQQRNWELAHSPSEKDRASYLSENFHLYSDNSLCGRKTELLHTFSTDPSGKTAFNRPNSKEDTLFPGISVEVSHGHTLGMQIVRISDGTTSLVYGADLIPTATHVRIPFIMAYDCFPMFILEEKKKLLNRIVDEQSYLFFEHCPRTDACKVKRTDKGDFEAHSFIQINELS
ncbi:MAG: MBL fold metallo-hydrolase [Bdellovibrionaceae bacterium]|nr:MBL fold metallo-hydrolase [Pseudobdellovibrionaceae bacterium]|tara:strand:+ start:2428 stop:3384 length:957 start_codon:yes stop_codon:yes gene_type:complete